MAQATLAEIKADLKSRLSEHRYKHTESVVKTALNYAAELKASDSKLFTDEDLKRVELAAWLHDRCKELDNEEQIELAKFYGIDIYEEDLAAPNTLHARVGAAVIEEQYEIVDSIVLQAVRAHTLGEIKMHNVSKVIYLADMLEPSRDQNKASDELNLIREIVLRDKDLDKALVTAMESKINYVLKKGHLVHPLSIQARNTLRL